MSADYNYAEWLKTHARKKSFMEKLERSLVPYPLFAALDMGALSEGDTVDVEHEGNVYRCCLRTRSLVNGRDVLLFTLTKVSMQDRWNDLLMGYSDFKVVLHEGHIVTIYPYREQYFEQIIGMFEAEQYFDLFRFRSLYVKNLLARYILLHLIQVHRPAMSLLYSVRQKGETIPVLAGTGEEVWVMYAFTKEEANALASRMRGRCRKLTVVYFIDRNFENEDRNGHASWPGVHVLSIKRFYRGLHLDTAERRQAEKQIFFLIEMLYGKRMDWDKQRLKACIQAAPSLTDRVGHWMPVPKMLVEDALNALVEDYDNPEDIFHMLCAANLVNTYTNRYKDSCKRSLSHKGKSGRQERRSLDHRVHLMYRFKNLVLDTIIHLLKMRSRHLQVSLAHVFGSKEYTLLASVRMEGHDYQFKFRGMHPAYIDMLHRLGVTDRSLCDTPRLQPVATALYLYSCCMKWDG